MEPSRSHGQETNASASPYEAAKVRKANKTGRSTSSPQDHVTQSRACLLCIQLGASCNTIEPICREKKERRVAFCAMRIVRAFCQPCDTVSFAPDMAVQRRELGLVVPESMDHRSPSDDALRPVLGCLDEPACSYTGPNELGSLLSASAPCLARQASFRQSLSVLMDCSSSGESRASDMSITRPASPVSGAAWRSSMVSVERRPCASSLVP
mmetsp:Transcript_7347/g.22061  ORF Transcript_7347/g.22061 Transcript_7347/m.22061 type:complete len:211 (-) Transcript_7347:285-917(-)|eukprot:scaffold5224_cov31-Tisochrysis_lutea.AAC.3